MSQKNVRAGMLPRPRPSMLSLALIKTSTPGAEYALAAALNGPCLTHSGLAGDLLLTEEVAARQHQGAREVDTVVRFWGEEFVALADAA